MIRMAIARSAGKGSGAMWTGDDLWFIGQPDHGLGPVNPFATALTRPKLALKLFFGTLFSFSMRLI